MLTKKEKEDILGKEKNTGSPEAQISLLTKKIEKLFAHLKKNPQDTHSKRGLLDMVNKRKKLLSYLKKEDEERYKKMVRSLGLKK